MPIKALPIGGLDHVVLRCQRLRETIDFYVEVLGCTVERTREDLGLYQLRAGDALIDLVALGSTLGGSTAPRPEHFNLAHFCLRLRHADWPAIRAHLQTHGLAWQEPARRYGAEGYGESIYVHDPEGNEVELKGPPEAS